MASSFFSPLFLPTDMPAGRNLVLFLLGVPGDLRGLLPASSGSPSPVVLLTLPRPGVEGALERPGVVGALGVADDRLLDPGEGCGSMA